MVPGNISPKYPIEKHVLDYVEHKNGLCKFRLGFPYAMYQDKDI